MSPTRVSAQPLRSGRAQVIACTRCGRAAADGIRFCHGCGEALGDVAKAKPGAPGPPREPIDALATLAAIASAWAWLVFPRELHRFLPQAGLVLGAATFLLGTTWPRRFGFRWLGLAAAIASMVYLGVLPARLEEAHRREAAREEAAVLDEIREVVKAGLEYARFNGGFVDTPRCMGLPEVCIPGYPSDGRPPILNPVHYVASSNGWDPTAHLTGERGVYLRSFHPGPAAAAGQGAGRVSATSLVRFAYVVREAESGPRADRRVFCGESTGRICVSEGADAEIVDGRCPAACVDREWVR